MGEETVDSLELVIQTKAEDAAQKVRDLATSVSDFGKSVSRQIDNMTKFSEALERIATVAADLGKINGLKGVLKEISSAMAVASGAGGQARGNAVKMATQARQAVTAAKKANPNAWRQYYFPKEGDFEATFPNASAFKGQTPGRVYPASTGFESERVSKKNAMDLAKALRSRYGLLNENLPGEKGAPWSLKNLNALILRARSGMGRYNGENAAWSTKNAESALDELAYAILNGAHPEPDGYMDIISALKELNGGIDFSKTAAGELGAKDVSVKRAMSMIRKRAGMRVGMLGKSTGLGIDHLTTSGHEAGDKDYSLYAIIEAALGGENVNPTEADLLDAVNRAHEARNKHFRDEFRGADPIEKIKEDLRAMILDIPVKGEEHEMGPSAENTQSMFRKMYEDKLAADEIKAAVEEENRLKQLATDVVQSHTVSAGTDLKMIVEDVTGVSREFKDASESAEVFQKAIAEGIVSNGSIPETLGMREFVDQATGVSSQFKSASESALTFKKAIAEELVRGQSIPETLGMQAFIDQTTGVSQEFKSAAESASVFNKAIAEGIVGRETIPEALDTRTFVEDITGVNREFKDARESAEAMSELLDRMDRQAAEAARVPHQYMQQYDPQTGAFNEIPGMRTTQDWMTQYDRDMEAAAQRAERIRRVAADVQTIRESLSFPQDMNYADMINRQMNIDGPVKSAKDSFAAFYPELADVLNGIRDTANASEEAERQIARLAEATDETREECVGLRDVLHAVGHALGNNGIGRALGQIARSLRMRVFREISRTLLNGVKEGFSNLYQWSKGVQGHFAGAMDTAASKLMLIKNSLATAVSPAIEAMIPLLSTAAGWVRNLSNAVAQFFALLNGDNSWTMAMETTEEWAAETKKNTSAAGKSIKDLLADWDELNIIQSQTGGGGSGSTGKKQTDFTKMFKETDVFDKWTENFNQIKGIVKAIGAGIAGWFVVSRVKDFLGQIGIAGDKVDEIFGKIGRVITGAVLLTVGLNVSYIAGTGFANEGLTGENLGEMFLGALASGLGGYLIGSTFGGPIGGVIGAIGGIALSIGMAIYAYVNEMNTNAREYIEEHLQSEVYGFDVNAEAEKVDVLITDAQKARDAVKDQLENTLGILSVIKLGVDDDAYQELYDSVLNENTGLIPKIRKELEADKNIITYYYQFKEKQGKKLNETTTGGMRSDEAFKVQLEGNEWLEQEYTRLGEEFAKCFNDGEKKGIKDGQAEVMQTILQTITGAELAAEKARGEAQAEITATNALKGTTKETVFENMPKVFEEYEKTLAEANRKSAEANIVALESEIAQLEKLGAPEKILEKNRALLKDLKENHLKTDYEEQAHNDYAAKEAEMAIRFIDQLFGGKQGFYGGDIAWMLGNNKTMGHSQNELTAFMRQQLYATANSAYGLGKDSTFFQKYGIKLEDILGIDSFKGMKASLAANGFEDNEIRQLFSGVGLSEKFIDSIMGGASTEAVQDLTDTVTELPEEIADALDEFADETEGGDAGPSERDYIVEVGSDTETDPRVAALENWWDKWRTNIPVGADAALDEAAKIWGDDFWKMFDELGGHIEQESAPFDLEDIPKEWYENWLNETPTVKVDDQTPLVVDPNASGIVQQSTVDGMANMQEKSLTEMNNFLSRACAALANIEESSERTSRKNLVVNIGASSGLGGTVERSLNLRGKVTGFVGSNP